MTSNRIWSLIATSLALTCTAAAQTPAPEVTLLDRIKAHLADELSRTPNYTCLETLSRFHGERGAHSQAAAKLVPLDTVRLDIVYSDHHEWYASPGGHGTSLADPAAFIGSGMIGSGAFASTLNNAIEDGVFTNRGEDLVAGRKAAKYDFRLSSDVSGMSVSIPGGTGTVGQEGSLWADPDTFDLIRFDSHAADIPPSIPLAEAGTLVNYARVRIGDRDVLLAQDGSMHMLEKDGTESFDHIEFTGCHSFSAQSDIRFDTEPAAPAVPPNAGSPATPAATAKAAQDLPASLTVTVQLTSRISDKDAVGTLIEGKVIGDVPRKGTVLIPDGSIVHGRIRRLERYSAGDAWIVGLEFIDIALTGGASVPFYADLMSMDKNSFIKPQLSESVTVSSIGSALPTKEPIGGEVTTKGTVSLHELPGVASFFVTGKSFTLPGSFRTVWQTRGPIR